MNKRFLSPSEVSVVVSDYFSSVVFPQEKEPKQTTEFLFLDGKDVETLMPEGPPQRYLEKAVIDTDNSIVFSYFVVSEGHCAGHFPDFPMLPMAKLGQIMAQAASLLVLVPDEENGSGRDRGPMIALTSSVEAIRSFAPKINGRKKYFIIPGDKLLLIAKETGGKGMIKNFCVSVYNEGELINEIDLTDSVMPKDMFVKFYKRQQGEDS